MKPEFLEYKRTNVAEIAKWEEGIDMTDISISKEDALAGSPKEGDMIARNPENHDDMWLIASEYFQANFELLTYELDTPESTQDKNLSFGQAIELMEQGVPMQRAVWNGKGLFVFMQIPAEIDLRIVPNMQSLPQKVKDIFMLRQTRDINDPWNSIKYSNQIAIVNPDNTINGWTPSVSDSLATDWQIFSE